MRIKRRIREHKFSYYVRSIGGVRSLQLDFATRPAENVRLFILNTVFLIHYFILDVQLCSMQVSRSLLGKTPSLFAGVVGSIPAAGKISGMLFTKGHYNGCHIRYEHVFFFECGRPLYQNMVNVEASRPNHSLPVGEDF